tara:strand:- start:1314 stop:1568 length:255 start_codon:yes stop_codon:yes gene_type:complete
MRNTFSLAFFFWAAERVVILSLCALRAISPLSAARLFWAVSVKRYLREPSYLLRDSGILAAAKFMGRFFINTTYLKTRRLTQLT